MARAEGFEPPSSALETDSLTLSLRPRFRKAIATSNRKPRPRPGSRVLLRMHLDPQDTTAHLTRLVILVMACLKVICIILTRCYRVTQFASTYNLEAAIDSSLGKNFWRTWQDSNLHRSSSLQPAFVARRLSSSHHRCTTLVCAERFELPSSRSQGECLKPD